MKEGNEYLYNQLIKLGDMMGDGLHHEPDGKWIEKEYRAICKVLFPERFKEVRKKKSFVIDNFMKRVEEEKKCDCGGSLKQSRKGSYSCHCLTCSKKYKATPKSKSKI